MRRTAPSNPSSFGQAVTFTVTVTPQVTGTPTGTVTFSDGSNQLGQSTLSEGTATLSTSRWRSAPISITVSYGDSNCLPIGHFWFFALPFSAIVLGLAPSLHRCLCASTRPRPCFIDDAVEFYQRLSLLILFGFQTECSEPGFDESHPRRSR